MSENKPNPAAKRKFYIIAFCVALGIDLLSSVLGRGEYRPSLIGLAVMITAALFFTFSLLRDR
mgnify:FL=1|jgi:hypothetical protein